EEVDGTAANRRNLSALPLRVENLSDLYDRPIYTQADEADRIGSPSDAAIGSGMHAGASDGSSSSDDGDRTLGSEDGSSPRNTRPTPQH
ncbi:MAG: hypothetical protein KDA55_00970, partial [Planctomycetales bacterium]|nr:hypothetical protein [Planctomycetales bacterium]